MFYWQLMPSLKFVVALLMRCLSSPDPEIPLVLLDATSVHLRNIMLRTGTTAGKSKAAVNFSVINL